MPPNIKVYINGFVLSTLLFDCANNTGDQEGFLFGSVTRNLRREISDQSLLNTQEEILISIYSSVPSGSYLSFYDGAGRIKNDELDFYLGDRRKNVIGWYRYRRFSAMYPSVRECYIHKYLRQTLFRGNDPNQQYFVCAVLSSSNHVNLATHSYDYAFFTQRRDCSFRPLSATILNLGDTRTSYRAGSLAMPFMDSTSFASCMESAWNFDGFYQIEDQIQHIHQTLRSKLESLQEELAASDAVNATLEDDIQRLSNELHSLLASQDAITDDENYDTAAVLTGSGEQNSLAASDASSSDELPEKDIKKRAADEPAESDRPSKRTCPDKYFESDTEDAESIEDNSDNIPSGSKESSLTSFSNSQLFTVDPDNGEASQPMAEQSPSKTKVATIKDMNLVPSPSSTVEVVISESGLQTYYVDNSFEQDTRSSSPDLSDIKVSSPEAVSPKEADSSNLSDQVIVAEVELYEAASYIIPETDEINNQNISTQTESSITTTRASSTSETSSKKMIPPFIIYASKECEEDLDKKRLSSNIEECHELVESTSNVVLSDKSNLEKEFDSDTDNSPTSTTGSNLKGNEEEKDSDIK